MGRSRNWLPNVARIRADGVAEIQVGRYVALIDAADLPPVRPFTWRPLVKPRIVRPIAWRYSAGGRRTIYMHQLIMSDVECVDHRNHDGLDNRRENLRSATGHQNTVYQRRRVTNRSGYKGVCWDREAQRWKAMFHCLGRAVYLGRFERREDAAAAYDAAALSAHGQFAYLNRPGADRATH